MRFSIWPIVRDHVRTLASSGQDRNCTYLFAVFAVVPVFSGAAYYFFGSPLRNGFYALTLTFFGIFLALMMNLQVAIFSVFQRKWSESGDLIMKEVLSERLKGRTALLTELNSNISYLSVISCVAIALSVFLSLIGSEHSLGSAFTICIYVHFLITLLVVLNRAHVLFKKEYEAE